MSLTNLPTDTARATVIILFAQQQAELAHCHQISLRIKTQIAAYEADAQDPELARNYLLVLTPEIMRNPVLDAILKDERRENKNKLRVLYADLEHVESHLVELDGFLRRLKEELVVVYGDF